MTCDEPEQEPEELSKGSSPVNVDRDCGRRLIHDGHGLSYARLSTLDQRAKPQSCLRPITELRADARTILVATASMIGTASAGAAEAPRTLSYLEAQTIFRRRRWDGRDAPPGHGAHPCAYSPGKTRLMTSPVVRVNRTPTTNPARKTSGSMTDPFLRRDPSGQDLTL